MQFQAPDSLWLLILLPVLIVLYLWVQRRRSRYALRYSSLSLVKEALGQGPKLRRHIPPLFFLFGTGFMILALARPMGVVSMPKELATVILAIDTSGSMRANDLQPTRLEAAKAAARSFIGLQDASTRIGIVAFSGNALLVQVPTLDRQLTITAVNRLTNQQSTAIGSAIYTSLDAIFQDPNAKPTPTPRDALVAPLITTPTPVPPGFHVPGTIVLLTDGQNRTGPSPIDAARVAADRGVRVFTIGVGTAEGATLQGGGGYGFRAALDEKTLKQIAQITEGKYFHASDESALLEIYKNLSKELTFQTEREESTVVFTAAAVVFFLISGLFSLLWFSRLP
jgi:Ca-activated chloride channel homolog